MTFLIEWHFYQVAAECMSPGRGSQMVYEIMKEIL